MKIFLDIDGVMVPANSWKRPEFHQDGFAMFSAQSVKALKKILDHTHANVFLTTSHKSSYDERQWIDIFASRGIKLTAINLLPENLLMVSRKEELLQWFIMNTPDESFVIIDDDKSLNGLPVFLKDRLVLTNGAIGLTNELADKAISILNREIPSVTA